MPPDEAYLRDILDSARLAIQYLAGSAWEDFARNVQVQDSVIRRIEVIGEAAGRVSRAGRRQWPHLPWADMVGMRNVMIHDYDALDLYIVWRTVTEDLPQLANQLAAILNE
jgi:uncharacterized protein with HEPN domain